MDYSRVIEKRDLAKIDKLNMLIDIKTFWDDVRKHTKNITSNHSLNRWQCLAEYRYKEISDIWNTIKKSNKIVVYCNEEFGGMCLYEPYGISEYVNGIGKKDDVLIIYFNKEYTHCRINDAKTLFYIIDKMFINSVVRAIDKGILKEVKDYKEPKITVYSINKLLNK